MSGSEMDHERVTFGSIFAGKGAKSIQQRGEFQTGESSLRASNPKEMHDVASTATVEQRKKVSRVF